MPLNIFYKEELPIDISHAIKNMMDEYPELSKDNIEYVAVYTDPPIEITFDELLELTKRIHDNAESSYEFRIHFKNGWEISWEIDIEECTMSLIMYFHDPRPLTVGHLKSLSTEKGIQRMKSAINDYATWNTKDLLPSKRKSAKEEIIKQIIEENHLEEYYEE